jgi:uncharacterized protein with HEPN domain
MRTDKIRLQDILDAIYQIEIYIKDGKRSFYESNLNLCFYSSFFYHF